jgi:hypothetical protein
MPNSHLKQEELTHALNEDRRRMARVDRRCHAVAEQTSDLEFVAASVDPASTGVIRQPFLAPPRLVEVNTEGEIAVYPAPEQRPDWEERLSGTFGVGAEAASALLSKLRRNLTSGAPASVHALNDALARIHAFAPRNIVEAELVIAAIVAEHHATRQLMASESGGHLPTILERTRLAQKFLALQLQALDRMSRARGLSTQIIRIEKVVLTGPTLIKHDEGGRR